MPSKKQKAKQPRLAINEMSDAEFNALLTAEPVVKKKSQVELNVELYKACQKGNINKVRSLIASGANVSWVYDAEHQTPLYLASKNNSLEIVDLLIAAGADLNTGNVVNGDTPFCIAAKYEHLNIMNKLKNAGADVNRPCGSGNPVFFVVGINNIKMLKKLIELEVDVNAVEWNNHQSPLHYASKRSNMEAMDLLIKAGADVNQVDKYGYTPLHLTVKYAYNLNNRYKYAIEKLTAAGADINKSANNGATPLYSAAQNNFTECVKLLIEKGADVNKATNVGESPLHAVFTYIGIYFDIDIVKMLLQASANPNKARIDTGDTPLHYIAQNKNNYTVNAVRAAIRLLLAARAEKNIINKDGLQPYQVAVNTEIRDFLQNNKPSTSDFKWQGWTRGDASMLDGIFSDKETAINYALCPVCMKYVIRQDACMYMSHNCAKLKGYYNQGIYDMYSNYEGTINWCTVCGRICKGHNHFQLSPAHETAPPVILLPTQNPFALSCEGEGGGGITEKLLRFRRLREHARTLQDQIGKIGWWDAMDELCEAMWNAPLTKMDAAVDKMMSEKKFNIPNTNFPLTLPPVENAPNIAFSGELPIVHPVETEAFKNALYIDDINIIQFRHTMANGIWNRHEGPDQQISREAFIVWLKTQLENPTAEIFGKCWAYKTQSQQSVLSESEKALMCDATLHPEEVKAALDLTDPEQAKLAEGYRKAFNAAFDIRKLYRI